MRRDPPAHLEIGARGGKIYLLPATCLPYTFTRLPKTTYLLSYLKLELSAIVLLLSGLFGSKARSGLGRA